MEPPNKIIVPKAKVAVDRRATVQPIPAPENRGLPQKAEASFGELDPGY